MSEIFSGEAAFHPSFKFLKKFFEALVTIRATPAGGSGKPLVLRVKIFENPGIRVAPGKNRRSLALGGGRSEVTIAA